MRKRPMFSKRAQVHGPTRFLLLALLSLAELTTSAETSTQAALTAALAGTPAVGLVTAMNTGRTLATIGNTNLQSTPGSLLKPLFLAAALQRGYLSPHTTVFCRRDLTIVADHRSWHLACTHPQTNASFNASDALAYSCNTYFAALAARIPPRQVEAILQHNGLTAALPQTVEQTKLLVLGLSGILVTPRQIAGAYRTLAQDWQQSPALEPVRQGLLNSVTYGMAHNAAVPQQQILGKTGTASDREHGPSHGWFAGLGAFHHQAVVVVIYLPTGNGADAARLAQQFFTARSSAQ